jgi:ParB-like chromosome segregation protein Spo0J
MPSHDKSSAGLTVEMAPIDSIKRYPNNPRKNAGAVEKVARLIEEYGWQQPIVVDRHRVIIVGDTRFLAGRLLGHPKVPILVAAHLTAKQARAYRLADNRSAEEAEWDTERLANELAVLRDGGFDLSLTAFDTAELNKLALVGSEADEEPEGRKIADTLQYQIVVECTDEADQVQTIKLLQTAGKKCRPLML